MKKVLAVALVAAMVLGTIGCGSSEKTTESPEAKNEETSSEDGEVTASGETLIVGTMANSLGLPVHWAEEAGYFDEVGLDVQIEIFATGAPINEAMAAGNLDVAVSGMASVYGLATGMYTYIGDGVITTGGESIYARADSKFVQTGEDADGIIGDAESIKGASILGPLATTAHYQAIKYAEHLGLTADDFSMVSMDYAQAYQAFVTGEGDLIAAKMPYTNQLEEAGYVRVCDMNMVSDSPIVDTIFAQNAIAKERPDDLVLFLECYYRACEDLMSDEENRREVAMTWYEEEGITYSESDMDTEIEVKDYYSREEVATEENPLGQFMVDIGEFFVDQDMITADDIPNVEASIDTSFLEAMKARMTE